MSRFFKATFTINISNHLPLEYTFKIGSDSEQEFIVGDSSRFLEIVRFLKNKRIYEFDVIKFGHWYDLGDNATLDMVLNWESGLKEYATRPRRVGIHYVYNGEAFDTLYHAAEYARDCDTNISDDHAEDCESICDISLKDETAFLI